MILEGIVTTVGESGAMHLAPMGPRVDATMKRFMLRPFHTSQTYRNLAAHGEFAQFKRSDVEGMISGITSFLADYLK